MAVDVAVAVGEDSGDLVFEVVVTSVSVVGCVSSKVVEEGSVRSIGGKVWHLALPESVKVLPSTGINRHS